MKRSIYLAGLTALGLIATMVTFEARQDRASLTVHEIADNLYMLANAPSVEGMGGGGNTAIFVTDGGVTLVDTKIKGYGQDILAAVRELTTTEAPSLIIRSATASPIPLVLPVTIATLPVRFAI